MKRIIFHILLTIFLLMVTVSAGCKKSPTSSETPQTEKGSWTVYTPYDWSHDGKPYQSIYGTIYSDAASDGMKQQLGEIADERFSQILKLFNFHNVSDFRYPPSYSKIEIYINRNHTENINWAYWGGFIITIRSLEISGHWYNYVVYTVRHELTHIFEFLIEGRELLGTDVWFKEGIAVHIGCLENTGWQTIKNLSELESWISQNQDVPGQGNPLKIHKNEDLPTGGNWTQYYQVFELAMRYLLDRKGIGKSYQDILSLFYDLRKGIAFHASFENHFWISIEDYEEEFFDRMRIYLN